MVNLKKHFLTDFQIVDFSVKKNCDFTEILLNEN